MFLGFVLNEHASPTEILADERSEKELQQKVTMLSQLCQALYDEYSWQVDNRAEQQLNGTYDAESDIVDMLKKAYDALCVTSMSRMLQISQLRSSLSALMIGLPSIPVGCLAILKLLVGAGSKGTAVPSKDKSSGGGGGGAVSNRGTRVEALTLLAQLVFSQDEEAGKSALWHILQQCLSEDFETRSRVINLVVRYVLSLHRLYFIFEFICFNSLSLYLSMYVRATSQ